MKKIFTLILLLAGCTAFSQPYNNEWIRFDQTYYKFKVGKAGVYRISKAVLDAAGIGDSQVENFELWRNGELVPFYAPVVTGQLPANGYLEFWAKPNDGKMDRVMYRDPAFQHSTELSLVSDTSVYFLSVNNNQSGFRFMDAPNDVASNSLPVEPYLMYTAGTYFKSRLHGGFAAVVGEYVYSSSYDKGEFWSSGYIVPSTPLVSSINNLFPNSAGPDAVLRFGAAGSALDPRTVKVSVNGTEVKDTLMDYFNDVHTSVPIPIALLSSGNASVQFRNTSAVATDRMVVSYYEITYPRQFNFGGQKNFEFSLPADPDGYYLEITNFNSGASAPVLFDLSNGRRYVGDIGVPGKVRLALPASALQTRYVLVNEDAGNINQVNSLTSRNFIKFSDVGNQGDYLIISNPRLYAGSSGNNPVMDYRDYRRSAAGGGFNAHVIDINELVDQFAFGVKMHPLSVRNFIKYARANFASPIHDVFLIGRGMDYIDSRLNETDTLVNRLNLVPTFGYPASDNLLAANDITYAVPAVPIGRLSVVYPYEVENYLQKVKEYEDAQHNLPNTIEGKLWMKNVIHVTGSSDPYLGTVLCNYMHAYKQIIEDTLFGASVYTFCKTSTNPVEQLNSDRIKELFEEGLSMVTYFGHSSATTLEFNLDNPDAYNNPGKYPVFYVNGCNAGNFFTFFPQRLIVNETLSEKFVLAKERGGIAFVASTHFGIVNYLNLYLDNLYKSLARTKYGYSLGEIQESALKGILDAAGPFDFYARMHAEEITLHGDPSLKLNVQPKPDYVIEQQLIKINPSFISIAENNFSLKVTVMNIGRADADSVRLEIKRQFPDGSTVVVYSKKIPGLELMDSISIDVPIVATRDKGNNKIIATIDTDQVIDEVSESNNTASKDFFIYEDEARPIYPYNFSIVNNQGQKLYASTSNPFSPQYQYVIEIDTTEKYNSPMKVSKMVTSNGGVIEVDPGIAYFDSTVYYWRISQVPGQGNDYHWNGYSFIYIGGSVDGYNQSHFFQHTKSETERVQIDSVTRKWKYGTRTNNLFLRNTMYPTGGTAEAEFTISVNGDAYIRSACVGRSLIFNVFDPVRFQPWVNVDSNGNSLYRYGSGSASCAPGRKYNFEFSYTTAASRKLMMDFMDSIPDGYYVAVRSIANVGDPLCLSSVWRADTALYGSNNSLYHKLLAAGFLDIDSLNIVRAWQMVYRKNDYTFQSKWSYTAGIYDKTVLSVDSYTYDTVGYIRSPKFGPAKGWKEIVWRGFSEENPTGDNPVISVIGIDTANVETRLYDIDKSSQNFDISAVSASQFPYLRLEMRNVDSLTLTPYQLQYWRIFYDPVPEGAIASNLFFESKDSLEIGETLHFGVAFKNISKIAFDSLKIKLMILDKDNIQHFIDLPRKRPIISGDSIMVKFDIDTKEYPGNNILFLDVNPDNDQPEQHHFNNFVYRNFFVKADLKNPLLDVTFDGVHILNRDIVSARPHILISLKDDAKFLLLNDTALTSVQVRFPNGELRTYRFDSDTLRFNPATSGDNNSATLDFNPQFLNQLNPEGDEYELIVKGKDRSGNKAGELEYRVTFRVISKPMISNLLNYPNPFSTSTAFVFTLTGSEIPQNIKIQILTITGKIVREITKDELGPIHIGRNITEFKWDGTDQFGQKLANGVYLYRVVTTLNGKRMDKYKADGDNTDKFFNNGYGKMYLMR